MTKPAAHSRTEPARSEAEGSPLDRVLHEPSRLAILSTLVGAPAGLSFGDLRDACELTDGNLSRHLRVLEEAGVVTIEKGFVGRRPRTTVSFSRAGRQRFLAYLDALERVIGEATRRAGRSAEGESGPGRGGGRPAAR